MRYVHPWLLWVESMFAVVHSFVAIDCCVRCFEHFLNLVVSVDFNLAQAEKVVNTTSAFEVFDQCVSFECFTSLPNKFLVVWPHKPSCFPQKVDIAKLISLESLKQCFNGRLLFLEMSQVLVG